MMDRGQHVGAAGRERRMRERGLVGSRSIGARAVMVITYRRHVPLLQHRTSLSLASRPVPSTGPVSQVCGVGGLAAALSSSRVLRREMSSDTRGGGQQGGGCVEARTAGGKQRREIRCRDSRMMMDDDQQQQQACTKSGWGQQTETTRKEDDDDDRQLRERARRILSPGRFLLSSCCR